MSQDKILIVDDDTHMRSALNLSLRKINKEGKIFSSAEDALSFIMLSAKVDKKQPFFSLSVI